MCGRYSIYESMDHYLKALAPANGWFEWVKDPLDAKKKQPYFIRLKTAEPMFFAARGQVWPGLEPHEGDGLVIITAVSDSGMVDIHDRRPLVLSPELARQWLEADLPAARAAEIAQEGCRPTAEFEWFKVSKDVGNVRNEGAYLIEEAA